MTHDPFCYFNRDNGEFDFMADICVRCQLIAKVRADTLDRLTTAAGPLWEMGRNFDDRVFADGWLTCFERIDQIVDAMKEQS